MQFALQFLHDFAASSVFRNVILPIVLVVLTVMFESMLADAKGRSRGEYKFRVWKKLRSSDVLTVSPPPQGDSNTQPSESGTGNESAGETGMAPYVGESGHEPEIRTWYRLEPNLTLSEVCDLNAQQSLHDVDLMHSGSIVDYNSLAINLMIGVFGVDFTFLYAGQRSSEVVGFAFFTHFVALVGVMRCVSRSYAANPKAPARRNYAVGAMVFAIIAVAITFFDA